MSSSLLIVSVIKLSYLRVMKNTSLHNKNNKFAFTLAEVLITLGIVGVISAMTLPVMISKSKQRIVETRLKVYYSMMNQAFKLAEADYGDMSGWGIPEKTYSQGGLGDYEWFKTYLQPYLKSSTIKETFHLYCVWYDGFAIEFINGTATSCGIAEAFSNDFLCMFYPKAEKIKNVCDDTEQAQKLVPGKDYFVFKINLKNNQGFQPYNSYDCYATTGTSNLPSRGCANVIKKIIGLFPQIIRLSFKILV